MRWFPTNITLKLLAQCTHIPQSTKPNQSCSHLPLTPHTSLHPAIHSYPNKEPKNKSSVTSHPNPNIRTPTVPSPLLLPSPIPNTQSQYPTSHIPSTPTLPNPPPRLRICDAALFPITPIMPPPPPPISTLRGGGGGGGASDKHLIGCSRRLAPGECPPLQPSASFRLTLGLCSGPGPMADLTPL
jgi:hypothetical protein